MIAVRVQLSPRTHARTHACTHAYPRRMGIFIFILMLCFLRGRHILPPFTDQYFNNSVTGYALRVGDYKLLIGNPGDSRVIAWPDQGDVAVAFGKSGGNIEGTTGHCRAASGRGPQPPKSDKTHCVLRPCLFDVVTDPTEIHDLAGNPAFADTLTQLMDRLDAAGQEGPPLSLAYPYTSAQETAMGATICANAQKTGFWEPVDAKPAGSN